MEVGYSEAGGWRALTRLGTISRLMPADLDRNGQANATDANPECDTSMNPSILSPTL
jgi:hypothetical protein